MNSVRIYTVLIPYIHSYFISKSPTFYLKCWLLEQNVLLKSLFTDHGSKWRGTIDEALLAEYPQRGHSYFSSARWFAWQQRTYIYKLILSFWKKKYWVALTLITSTKASIQSKYPHHDLRLLKLKRCLCTFTAF